MTIAFIVVTYNQYWQALLFKLLTAVAVTEAQRADGARLEVASSLRSATRCEISWSRHSKTRYPSIEKNKPNQE
ncbi:hypothetical protein NIES4102_15360 [Chondrocystis sp. NIES-4102]|nr:hypothetical protein NIES4102_15360 [Chondrocystis sp. NIES-4102]